MAEKVKNSQSNFIKPLLEKLHIERKAIRIFIKEAPAKSRFRTKNNKQVPSTSLSVLFFSFRIPSYTKKTWARSTINHLRQRISAQRYRSAFTEVTARQTYPLCLPNNIHRRMEVHSGSERGSAWVEWSWQRRCRITVR